MCIRDSFYTCQGQDSPLRQQVVAWELSNDLSSATRLEVLVDIARDTSHSGCRLRVDDEGYLWATFGDDFSATTPQDTNSLHGKILRIDPLTGAGHPDNLNAGVDRDPRIFTLGHRNPQGLSFHPVTGQAWISEHGPDIEDEVNALVPGGNYGWNPLGPAGPDVYDQDGRSMTDLSIPGVISAPWNSGSDTIAPGGIAFLSGAEWGDFNGAIAMTTLKDQRLYLLRFDSEGALFDQTIPAELDRSEFGRLRSALLGPDGALYISTSNSGFTNEDDRRADSILRITPSSGPREAADPRQIEVRSEGDTGEEEIELQIDGETVATFELTDRLATYTYSHDTDPTGAEIRVEFTNDGRTSNGDDRNVTVDFIRVGDDVLQTEDPSVFSTGTFAAGTGCAPGNKQSERLHCTGYFQYTTSDGAPPNDPPADDPVDLPVFDDQPDDDDLPADDPVTGDHQIEVRAEGDTGEEEIELQIDGETVATFQLTDRLATYTYTHDSDPFGTDIRIAFVNNGRTSNGDDKNVTVDFITIDDVVFQTEDPSVFSTGTYTRGSGCDDANKQSERLHCTGYFQYTS